MIDTTEIILGLLAFLSIGYTARINFKHQQLKTKDERRHQEREQEKADKKKRREKAAAEAEEKRATDLSQMETWSNQMMTQQKAMSEKIEKLELKNHKLYERFEAVKAGMLTVKIFGNDAPFALWVKDRDGKRLFHNSKYESMTGYIFMPNAGKTDFEITNDAEMAGIWGMNDNHVMEKGLYFITVEPCAHKDRPNETFMVLAIKWPTRLYGQISGTAGIAIPVSEIESVLADQMAV